MPPLAALAFRRGAVGDTEIGLKAGRVFGAGVGQGGGGDRGWNGVESFANKEQHRRIVRLCLCPKVHTEVASQVQHSGFDHSIPRKQVPSKAQSSWVSLNTRAAPLSPVKGR